MNSRAFNELIVILIPLLVLFTFGDVVAPLPKEDRAAGQMRMVEHS